MASDMVTDCQWPQCRNLAEHYVRRGTDWQMTDMAVCHKHLRAFRALSNAGAQLVSEHRQPRNRHRVMARRTGDFMGSQDGPGR